MVMELLRKMLEVTMTRGAQSAGLVTYRQDGGDAQGCRARTVSGKRTDLARLVLSKFSRVIERRRPLLGAGLIAAPQLFQGHTRFAHSSKCFDSSDSSHSSDSFEPSDSSDSSNSSILRLLRLL